MKSTWLLLMSTGVFVGNGFTQEHLALSRDNAGKPLVDVFVTWNTVVADYEGNSNDVIVTSDTIYRLKMSGGLLSPSKERYFYVEILPEFHRTWLNIYPPFDDFYLDGQFSRRERVPWEDNRPAMRFHLFRLSGEKIMAMDLPLSYCGNYKVARWLDNDWIWLRHRDGHASGNWFSLFINVATGQKRLVGLQIREPIVAPGRIVTFINQGIFYVDFRPVYPMYGDPLPDFGQKEGWEAYKNKYIVGREKRPSHQLQEYPYHYIEDSYYVTTDTKRAILLDNRPMDSLRLISRWTSPWTEVKRPKTAPPGAPPPEVVVIDLEKVEVTKDPKRYSRTFSFPFAPDARLLRDDEKKEVRVVSSEQETLWRKSFDEIKGLK